MASSKLRDTGNDSIRGLAIDLVEYNVESRQVEVEEGGHNCLSPLSF
jgi:hypothetical protein